MTADPFWDDPFHSVAFAAFVQQAREEGGWPDSEKTRQRAYRLYEEELTARSAANPGQAQQPLAPPAGSAYPPREQSKEPA
ncbi:hypothetical protein OJF2_51680 [Aquisphaera giovannonii]|uniref:Uncharacterized protein n=1 Tax=Aquisphaera giovannonii TaxID=406548 RepID=A0A5B9W8K6_9BACT|nr:hypothetical protein [Aquisphaera giovannonii]QEH36584.1 hypothetical protein OJF2_51680 [Aquisphaera giovannonii]